MSEKIMSTQEIHNWMKNANDYVKMRYAVNWRLPHSLFNVSCKFFNPDCIQDIDWFKIFQSFDLGYWENGNKVTPVGGTIK